MTKSTITRERVVALIAEHSYDSALVDALEHLLAAMDSEPDCKERKLFCSTDTARMRKVISASAGSEATPLYLHAQPAPELKPVGYLFISDQGAIVYSPTDWGMPGFRLVGKIYGDIDVESQPAPTCESITVTDDMAYAFHHALTDSMIGADDVEEIKTGLRAVFANLTAPVVSAEYPDRLPCSVLLEPGLRFGKGIKTSTMLAALARSAVHESDMAALSPEDRAEFQARIEDFKALIAQPAPVVEREPIAWLNDAYLARGVVDGEAGSEDAGPGYIPVYREAGPQSAPVVPEEITIETATIIAYGLPTTNIGAIFKAGHDACRAARLKAQPQNAPQNIPEIIPGWIPVSERLPFDEIVTLPKPMGGPFLVAYSSGRVDITWFSCWQDAGGRCGKWDTENTTLSIAMKLGKVTHWMPLPAAPQEVR